MDSLPFKQSKVKTHTTVSQAESEREEPRFPYSLIEADHVPLVRFRLLRLHPLAFRISEIASCTIPDLSKRRTVRPLDRFLLRHLELYLGDCFPRARRLGEARGDCFPELCSSHRTPGRSQGQVKVGSVIEEPTEDPELCGSCGHKAAAQNGSNNGGRR